MIDCSASYHMLHYTVCQEVYMLYGSMCLVVKLLFITVYNPQSTDLIFIALMYCLSKVFKFKPCTVCFQESTVL